MSSGASILSLHKQKKCGNCKLAAVSFQFDNSKLDPNEEVFIRPIVKKISENGEWMDLIETPYSILLNNKTSKIIISLKSRNVNFHEDNDYLVGFEVINRTNKEKVLSFQATTMKGAKTFLRKNPTSEWFDLGKSTNFSLDYELFFSGCL